VIQSSITADRTQARQSYVDAVDEWVGLTGMSGERAGCLPLMREDGNRTKHPTGLEPGNPESCFISDRWRIREAATKVEFVPRTGKCLEKHKSSPERGALVTPTGTRQSWQGIDFASILS